MIFGRKVCLVVFTLVIFTEANKCKWSPAHWCSSLEIAKQCNVLDLCLKHAQRSPYKVEPVQITLFYESLCPDCQLFMADQLFPTFQKLSSIMNITLMPFGNADEQKVGDKWTFECQHGPPECLGNLIETCAIHALKDINVYLPFIHCMEGSITSESVEQSAKNCASVVQVDYSVINACVNSSLGNQLQHEIAVETKKQNLQYVPWVQINGVHSETLQKEAENDLSKLICETYQGEKPDICVNQEKFQHCLR